MNVIWIMKNFIGKKCIEAFAREFWCYGVQVTNCCCMFLNFENTKLIKILHSDESHSWEFEEVDEIVDRNSGLGDSEFFYPYSSVRIVDGTGLTLEEYVEDQEGNWFLNFSSGVQLKFMYDNYKGEARYEVCI